MAALLGF